MEMTSDQCTPTKKRPAFLTAFTALDFFILVFDMLAFIDTGYYIEKLRISNKRRSEFFRFFFLNFIFYFSKFFVNLTF